MIDMAVLKHIAFIPDGNRRWAKERHVSALEGHRRGFRVMKDVVKWSFEAGVQEVTFWGFSTENWKRSEEEVSYLLELFSFFLKKEIASLKKDGIRFCFIGSFEGLSDALRDLVQRAEAETEAGTRGVVNMCFNYGGKEEIVDVVRKAIEKGYSADQIDASLVDSLIRSARMTDIDLIVRTSGEQRLSGFQPWKGAYSELVFASEHWPSFDKDVFDRVVEEFSRRQRRFGG